MARVKIVTDSNSGILQQEGKDLGIFVIPMPFTVDGYEYLEEISISQEEFHQHLNNNAEVTTSQPSQFYLQEIFDELLKDNDELVFIPMSSGLSGTCTNATALASQYDGKVQVVDNFAVSLVQKQSVYRAIKLAQEGKSAVQIKQLLEEDKENSAIYLTVATLKYLKKGGRITAAAAALGSLLKIKPILTSNGGKFEKHSMALNFVQAKKKIIDLIKHDLTTKFKDKYEAGQMAIGVAQANNIEDALKMKEEILKELPNVKFTWVDYLSLSVSCHTGGGALGVAIYPQY